ncbi:MAG: Crp/Fnr family transcriptional regulator [Planctomycetales bacterium]|nr:Crp/Fnr family transcriptional regulator [Planctomycetales bacterium]
MPLESGQVLYQAQSEIEYSYFPTTGTLSSVVVLSTGDMIEVATIGREGMVGLPSFLEENRSTNRVFCQVPGDVLRIETNRLERAAMQEGPLRKVLLQYQAAFMFQISQSVACNGLHVLPERCCRWLLMTHDRVGGDEIRLTHEFLSAMLGVRRSSVTETLQELARKGLIEYGRGKIVIKDRQGIEDGSCECYESVRAEYSRLLK